MQVEREERGRVYEGKILPQKLFLWIHTPTRVGSSSLSSLVGSGNKTIRFLDKMLKYGHMCYVVRAPKDTELCGMM